MALRMIIQSVALFVLTSDSTSVGSRLCQRKSRFVRAAAMLDA